MNARSLATAYLQPTPALRRTAPDGVRTRVRAPAVGPWRSLRASGPDAVETPRNRAVAAVALVGAGLASGAVDLEGGLSGLLHVQVTVRELLLAGVLFFLWTRMLDRVLRSTWGGASPAWRWVRMVAATVAGTAAAVGLWALGAEAPAASFSPGMFWVGSVVAGTAALTVSRGLDVRMPRAEARRVVIVGTGPRALRLHDEVRSAPAGTYELLGFVDSDFHLAPAEVRRQRLGRLDALEEILLRRVVDEVLIALPVKSHYAEIQRAIEICERAGVESKYLADVFECSVARPCYEPTGAIPAVAMKVMADDSRRLLKRAIDLVGAAVGLVLLAPLMLGIALAIRATSPGPALFAQERYGLNKRRFRMYKFRTMVANAEELQRELEASNEAEGPVFKIREDPRVTRIGRLLRRTSLDELPQLWNVLRGEMSLVGPRPLPQRDVHLFGESWLMRRFSVPPGLTCLWQTCGRSDVGFDDWMALDLRYIDSWSLRLDLKILLKTVPVVLRGHGAV